MATKRLIHWIKFESDVISSMNQEFQPNKERVDRHGVFFLFDQTYSSEKMSYIYIYIYIYIYFKHVWYDNEDTYRSYLPTLSFGQDMTHDQFLSGV